MDDLISRQAAIDAVKRLHDVALANWKETKISANTMIDALKDLPSAQPEQRWIPCSERLPEKECLYLVSGDSEIWICRFICLRFFRGWSNPANCPVAKAWMPLPEPYDPLAGHMNPPEE